MQNDVCNLEINTWIRVDQLLMMMTIGMVVASTATTKNEMISLPTLPKLPVGRLYVFFDKCLFKSFVHFLSSFLNFPILLLSCRSPLNILDINPLSDKWFANISSRSVNCLFTLLIVSFAV